MDNSKNKSIRKRNRMLGYDYSQNNIYFLTICVDKRRKILSEIIIGDVFCPAHVLLTDIGKTVEQHIISSEKMEGVSVLNYIIMPNHIHILLEYIGNDGSSKAPTPTNSFIPHYVSTLKRFINKQIGCNIWQRGYYDHIIRNEDDYRKVYDYIENNPARWAEDKYYS